MSNIYEQKARKYKNKYIKLKQKYFGKGWAFIEELNNLPIDSSYDSKTNEEITKIINKYVTKEKSDNNLSSCKYDILKLEKKLIDRYNENKSNNFTFPEIKNVLDCIADILIYFKENKYINDDKMCWQIDQTINIIKNASQ